MAIEVIMPKLGNTVESCVILEWKKSEGDNVKTGEPLCDVETDKATFEVEAEADGVLLKKFFKEGDDVPVLTAIAVIGKKGENIEDFTRGKKQVNIKQPEVKKEVREKKSEPAQKREVHSITQSSDKKAVSPRAVKLAEKNGINLKRVTGTGPGGRITEKDVQKAIDEQEPFTKAAAAVSKDMDNINIKSGSSIGGRIGLSDLAGDKLEEAQANRNLEMMGSFEKVPVKGIRKRISDLMYESVQNTAQFTLHSSAAATMLLEYRAKFKSSPEELGLNKITINDLILFCTAKTLERFKELNAHFIGGVIYKFKSVHLGNAVDTKSGLIVPVIRNADKMSLHEISRTARMLMVACSDGTINPDQLKGSTFTVTNLGAVGIENFTPILHYPETAILGVGTIQLKPVMKNGKVEFVNHIGLSLTINHQVVDGAPAARFLKELSHMIANLNLSLAF